MAAAAGHKIYLYGGTEKTLERLIARLGAEFPGLQIAGAEAPVWEGRTIPGIAQSIERINGFAEGAGAKFQSLESLGDASLIAPIFQLY